MIPNIPFPLPSEYAEFYAPYLANLKYVSLFDELDKQKKIWQSQILVISEEVGHFSYDEGKWTVKEILQHILDSERVFVYRALCIARNDKTSLPGFNENEYVNHSNANKKTIEDLVHAHTALRNSTQSFFKQLDEGALSNIGTANGSPISVRAIAYIIAGHERHHLNVLKERYRLNLNL